MSQSVPAPAAPARERSCPASPLPARREAFTLYQHMLVSTLSCTVKTPSSDTEPSPVAA